MSRQLLTIKYRMQTSLRKLILLCVLCLFNLPAFADKFELKHADTLHSNDNQIIVKGKIIVHYNNAVIEASEGVIENSTDNNSPEKAFFTGNVKLISNDKKITADKITFLIKDRTIHAEGNVISELKDKKNTLINISSDSQKLSWDGKDAIATGNIKTKYQDINVNSDEAVIHYKDKKPEEAVFTGNPAILNEPNSITKAKNITFQLATHDVHAASNVESLIWPDDTKPKDEQEPVTLLTEELLIQDNANVITAKGAGEKVRINYETTKGESIIAFLLKDKTSGKPEKIIFQGNAEVSQEDKTLISEEIVFNFKDKKLISNTKTNTRPRTLIFR